MDFRQLTYFNAIVEWGSVTRAARALHVAQPAVSRSIKGLEEQLGVTLFERFGRGLRLSEAGRILAGRAAAILSDVRQAEQETAAAVDIIKGNLKLGLPPSMAAAFAPDLVASAAARWPALRLQIVESYSGYIHEWLLEGRVDIAVLNVATLDRKGLILQPFFEDHMVAVFPPGRVKGRDRIALPLLAREDVILPGAGHGLRRIVDDAAAGAGVSITPAWEVDSVSIIKELVLREAGIAILPKGSVLREVQRGELAALAISDPAIRRTLVLGHAKRQSGVRAIQLLSGLMVELVCQEGPY